jgi:hypothetical protein
MLKEQAIFQIASINKVKVGPARRDGEEEEEETQVEESGLPR